MEIVLSDSALNDLQDILDWYQQERIPEVGMRLVDTILQQVDQIKDHPLSGRVVSEYANPNLRELIRPPYRIIYSIEETTYCIVRVWRSERLLHLD